MRTAKIIQNGPSTGHAIHPEAELEITLEAEQLGKEDEQNPNFDSKAMDMLASISSSPERSSRK